MLQTPLFLESRLVLGVFAATSARRTVGGARAGVRAGQRFLLRLFLPLTLSFSLSFSVRGGRQSKVVPSTGQNVAWWERERERERERADDNAATFSLRNCCTDKKISR